MAVLREIVGHALREKNVTSVDAIHHPLRDIDASVGDVRAPGPLWMPIRTCTAG